MAGRAVSWALRTGVRKGVIGGSGPWLVVAAAAGVVKLLNREPSNKALTLKLKPGERYTILCSDEPLPK
jgi:hypothetical protein